MPETPKFEPEEASVETAAPQEQGYSRRDFLRLAAIGTLAAGAEQPSEAVEKPHPKKYLTGWLAGKNLSDLYSAYTGINGRVPPEAEIDFHYQLSLMWDKKDKRSGQNKVVVDTGKKLLKDYQEHAHTMTVRAYHNLVQHTVKELTDNVDWEKLRQIKNMSPEQMQLAKHICLSANARHLLAYCLTELMPSKDGRLNVEVLNFLLESAGREYIEAIPAMFDKKTSFGPYQFTEFALYDDNRERRGASIPNQALKKGKIPNSVAQLRGMDHHKAGYLFMTDNFCNLVRHLSAKEFAVLSRVWKDKENDLVAYAATAHHGPGAAMGIAKRWLDNGAKLPFVRSCGRVYGLYAEKTGANFSALKKIAE